MGIIYVNDWVKEFIKSHAEWSPQEIYGWLVGFETPKKDIIVVTAISCERYKKQHVAGAQPDPIEIMELGASIPQGLGIIGLYHSHPDEVFHSATDDETLINLSKFFPKMISAVSNGSVIKWYQLESSDKTSEIKVEYLDFSPKRIKFLTTFAELNFNIPIKLNIPFIPQISMALRNEFEYTWENGVFSILKNEDFSEKNLIKKRGYHLNSKELFSPNKIKSIKKRRYSELNIKDFRILLEPDYNLMINLSLNRFNNSKDDLHKYFNPETEEILISGSIPLFGLYFINRNDSGISLDSLMEKIKSELIDDLTFKVSRGILKFFYSSNQLKLVLPDTVLLPYPQIPLKFRIILKKIDVVKNQFDSEIVKNLSHFNNFSRNNLPSIQNIINMEDASLESIQKRVIVLAQNKKKENWNIFT